ncbi:MAG: hypothetical protein KGV46_01420 [Pasteurella sp.]|nr:hypothetical protein [Pasteurella sp.]
MITKRELKELTDKINQKLKIYAMSFHLSFHFSEERVNDIRNNPVITIEELEDIFEQFIQTHILSVVAMNDKECFVICCRKTNIHIPCAIEKKYDRYGGLSHKNIVITIMRKEKFGTRDQDTLFVINNK